MKRYVVFIPLAVFVFFLLGVPMLARGETTDNLQSQIDAKTAEIEQLEKEAAQFRLAIQEKKGEAETLKAALQRIERAIKKLTLDISVTKKNIEKTELEMTRLAGDITISAERQRRLQSGLGAMLRALAEFERESPLTAMFAERGITEFFRRLDTIALVNKNILLTIDATRGVRRVLEQKKSATETKNAELENLGRKLATQSSIQRSEKKERETLLSLTRLEEKKYQRMLADRENRRRALEREIEDIETQIRISIDPASLPPKKSGVLASPLPDFSRESCWKNGTITAANCITQFFGNTDFAAQGAYNGKGHNGADFRADIGTPTFAAEEGTVAALGDTDAVDINQGAGCAGASYGKWVLIRHPNNLSTLYAHLSAIEAREGQNIGRGGRIGFSGKSGYATGPHLHLTVFPTKAVEIKSFPSRVCGRTLTIPVADQRWYLNPLDYL
ncbi:MAG: peptidoglycan DD-metalloendopeptidase family protein [Patescibacteria group bacterium]